MTDSLSGVVLKLHYGDRAEHHICAHSERKRRLGHSYQTSIERLCKNFEATDPPLSDTSDRFLDPTHPQPTKDQRPQDFDIRTDVTGEPSTTPYEAIDRWDLFWLGHCGSRFPRASDRNVPLGRAVICDDGTVPDPQHVKMQFGDFALVQIYPAHTRVVSRAWTNTCNLGYGIFFARCSALTV